MLVTVTRERVGLPRSQDAEPVAAGQARRADAVHGLILRLVVADHERDVEIGRGLLERDAVRAVRGQRLLLVMRGCNS